jgi:hypothetical protein
LLYNTPLGRFKKSKRDWNQLLVCVDELIYWVKTYGKYQKSMEAVLDASKEFGLEVNAETKCMFVSHHQAAVQNYNRPIKYLINP